MTSPEIPARVLQFLAGHIDSVPQLEALLLLWEDPQRLWSEEELAGRIYVGRPVAATIGVIVTASLAASAFFLKFWRQTRDLLFLGFSAALRSKA